MPSCNGREREEKKLRIIKLSIKSLAHININFCEKTCSRTLTTCFDVGKKAWIKLFITVKVRVRHGGEQRIIHAGSAGNGLSELEVLLHRWTEKSARYRWLLYFWLVESLVGILLDWIA